MDVFKLLKQDHERVKSIFKKMQKISHKTRSEGFDQAARKADAPS